MRVGRLKYLTNQVKHRTRRLSQLYRSSDIVTNDRGKRRFLGIYKRLHQIAFGLGYRIEDLLRDKLLAYGPTIPPRTRAFRGDETRTSFFANLYEIDDMIYDLSKQNKFWPNFNAEGLFTDFDNTINRLLQWFLQMDDEHMTSDLQEQDLDLLLHFYTTLALIIFRIKNEKRIELVTTRAPLD